MADRTNYAQSLMHMIKGNLGAGILAMPASFKHTGLICGILGLPVLCFVCCYCVHALVRSSQILESKFKNLEVNYFNLARKSFELGPTWFRSLSETISNLVDSALLLTGIGICCIYIVFVVDNIISILETYNYTVSKSMVFLAIFPVALALSCVRTLSRLAVASMVANCIQVVGLSLVVENLVRGLDKVDFTERHYFRPLPETALGFGSAIFAFEGISVVLPIYSRMKNPRQMSSPFGVTNISFVAILVLYLIVGLLGYLKFGNDVKDSITLNLPAEPLYDAVRAMFTASMLLSYPLQFYVPNEIIWNWAKKNLLQQNKEEFTVKQALAAVLPPPSSSSEKAVHVVTNKQPFEQLATGENGKQQLNSNEKKAPLDSSAITLNSTGKGNQVIAFENCPAADSELQTNLCPIPLRYEYYCRILVVTLTFTLAFTVPKLNLLMDLIGSFSGAALCLTIPALIHIGAIWDNKKGATKVALVTLDSIIIIFSVFTGLGGTLSSVVSIAESFRR